MCLGNENHCNMWRVNGERLAAVERLHYFRQTYIDRRQECIAQLMWGHCAAVLGSDGGQVVDGHAMGESFWLFISNHDL